MISFITSPVQGPLVIDISSCSPDEDEKSISDWFGISVHDPVLIDRGDDELVDEEVVEVVEVASILKLKLELMV